MPKSPQGIESLRGKRDEKALLLHSEQLVVSRRLVPGETVKVTTRTASRDQAVEVELHHERVEVERVPIGREIDAVPSVREEDGILIMPVVEEVLVVQRKLVLKEEVRIRRRAVTEVHHETMSVRHEDILVTRHPSEETIVAIYDTAAHAQAAVRDLRQANVPEGAITSRSKNDTAMSGTTRSAEPEQGFWASLFGGEPDHDTATYDRSIDGGSTVVAVQVSSEHYDRVSAILEQHSPIDIDERMVAVQTSEPKAPSTPSKTKPAEGDTLSLSEEKLSVGKRVVSGGTTRIRRYVVETPVEENVTLHHEQVVLDRHPVTDGTKVGADAFTERTIEITESSEEAVVGKTARVVEEINLRKNVTDEVKTIKDTVRRDEVEVETVPGKMDNRTKI